MSRAKPKHIQSQTGYASTAQPNVDHLYEVLAKILEDAKVNKVYGSATLHWRFVDGAVQDRVDETLVRRHIQKKT